MEEEVKVDQTSSGQENADDSQNSDESGNDLATQLAKANELANNYKIRAEKAERKAKDSPKEELKQSASNISQTDIIAIVRASVADEDLEDVRDYAKLKGISIADALKTNVVKTLLKEKTEERSTANASHTGSAKRTTQRVTDESLLDKARKGEDLPDSDDDIERLIAARKAPKK